MAKKIDVNGLDHYHDKVSAMLASEYSSSKTYAVGDYCFHAGTLYECTTAITTAENWTAGHWTAAKLAEDTSALKTALTVANNALVGAFAMDYSDILYTTSSENAYIKYNDGTPKTNEKYIYTDYIDITPYSSIKYTRTKHTTASPLVGIAFYDSSKTYISGVRGVSSADADGYVSELYEPTIPENAVYVRCSIFKDTATYGNFSIYGYANIADAVEDLLAEKIQKIDNVTGISAKGQYPLAPTSTAFSSMTVVENNLLIFSPSNDAHTDTANVNVMSIAADGSLTGVKTLTHNLGHCNTVDYCPNRDTLILGNGGQSSNTEPNQIYIIEGFSDLLSGESITLSDAITIDVSNIGIDFGKQLNVCWAYDNNGKYDLAYAISNDGTTQTVRLLMLGRGSTALQYGSIITAEDDHFNGTFDVKGTWTRPYNTNIANNDTQLFKGMIYECSGHNGGIHFGRLKLNADNTISSEYFSQNVYAYNGNQRTIVSQGIALKDDMMFIGNSTDKVIGLYQTV